MTVDAKWLEHAEQARQSAENEARGLRAELEKERARAREWQAQATEAERGRDAAREALRLADHAFTLATGKGPAVDYHTASVRAHRAVRAALGLPPTHGG